MKHSMVTLWDATQLRKMSELQVHGVPGAKLTNVTQREKAARGAADIKRWVQVQTRKLFSHKSEG